MTRSKRARHPKGAGVIIFILLLGFLALIAGILIALSEEGYLGGTGANGANGKNPAKKSSLFDRFTRSQDSPRTTDTTGKPPHQERQVSHTSDQKTETSPDEKSRKDPRTPEEKPVSPDRDKGSATPHGDRIPREKSGTPSIPPESQPDGPRTGTARLPADSRNKNEYPVEIKGKVAIVIDDFGNTMKNVDEFCNLDAPITFAVLPQLPYSTRVSGKAADAGKEIILHLPLENHSGINPGPGTMTGGMSAEEIHLLFEKNLADVPGAVGVNNHEGSKGTENEILMEEVIAAAGKHNLFVLDSRTSAKSLLQETASRQGIPNTRRNVFLDNEDNIEAISSQLEVLTQKAIKEGSAVGIGHCRKNTLLALEKMIPKMREQGIEFVFISQLVR